MSSRSFVATTVRDERSNSPPTVPPAFFDTLRSTLCPRPLVFTATLQMQKYWHSPENKFYEYLFHDHSSIKVTCTFTKCVRHDYFKSRQDNFKIVDVIMTKGLNPVLIKNRSDFTWATC